MGTFQCTNGTSAVIPLVATLSRTNRTKTISPAMGTGIATSQAFTIGPDMITAGAARSTNAVLPDMSSFGCTHKLINRTGFDFSGFGGKDRSIIPCREITPAFKNVLLVILGIFLLIYRCNKVPPGVGASGIEE